MNMFPKWQSWAFVKDFRKRFMPSTMTFEVIKCCIGYVSKLWCNTEMPTLPISSGGSRYFTPTPDLMISILILPILWYFRTDQYIIFELYEKYRLLTLACSNSTMFAATEFYVKAKKIRSSERLAEQRAYLAAACDMTNGTSLRTSPAVPAPWWVSGRRSWR